MINYYKKNKKGKSNEEKLRYCQLAAKVGVPVVAGGFVLIYWITGLTLYYFPSI